LQGVRDLRTLFIRNGEWRSKENVVAAPTVDTALRWLRQDVLLRSGLPDFFRDSGFFREWFARGFVFYKFDTLQKAETPNVADVWVFG